MLLDEVIVATTTNEKDDILCEYLEKVSIPYYRGSEENVLDRVLKTALYYNADLIVEVTGDCPLLDYVLVDESIGFFLKTNSDYVGNTCITSAYPRGQDVKVFSTETLCVVNALTQDPDDQEHVSLYIYNNSDRFKCTPLPPPHFTIPDKARLTVDYPQDLEMIWKIIGDLGVECSIVEICRLLEDKPGLMEINGNLGASYINDDTRYG